MFGLKHIEIKKNYFTDMNIKSLPPTVQTENSIQKLKNTFFFKSNNFLSPKVCKFKNEIQYFSCLLYTSRCV